MTMGLDGKGELPSPVSRQSLVMMMMMMMMMIDFGKIELTYRRRRCQQ
jgi:hypothetical protein